MICNRDCLHCVYDDCINDAMDADSYQESNRIDNDIRRLSDSKVAARRRVYYEAHKDEIAARRRVYCEAHKDEIAARRRVYYEAHKDYWRDYRAAHKGAQL